MISITCQPHTIASVNGVINADYNACFTVGVVGCYPRINGLIIVETLSLQMIFESHGCCFFLKILQSLFVILRDSFNLALNNL